jgi:hypothetical protein
MRISIFYALLSLLLVGCSESYYGELIFVEPDYEDDFEFPFFLFIPKNVAQNEKVFLIIEPNNSGFVDDNLQTHIEKSERIATKDFYIGNHVAQRLKLPLLVPVFPRSKSESKIYTHSLDRDVMLQKGNQLERLDMQLIGMFKKARTKLSNKNIQTHQQFLLAGFSASATFANRFTLIHPERVRAVAAGGLNGLLILPADTLENEALNYPIGTSDINALTDKPFAKDSFLKTPQFYFMGKLDENDAIPYSDAFDQDQREQIYRLLGKQMQPQRWDRCTEIYRNMNVNVTIVSYEDAGHEQTESIKHDIVKFFGEVIE